MGLKAREKSKFPVAECVPNCYLKKVQYKTGEREGDVWEAIIFSFVHNEDWISLFIRKVDKKKFESTTQFEHKRYQTGLAIERILSIYLDSHGMIDFREGLATIDRNFKSYVEYVIETLDATDYKKVPVDLKTVPTKTEEAKIMPYGVFIRRAGDLTKVLQYTDWENDLISNLYNNQNTN